MKARTEDSVLEHMSRMWFKWGRRLSGKNKPWVEAKVRALHVLFNDAQPRIDADPFRFLDVGIGDMLHWAQWPPFMVGEVDYLGVDGCDTVLNAMRAKHGERDNVVFLELKFSDLVNAYREGHRWPVDCIVALDVLYHVPDDDVYKGMLDMLFQDGEHRYVLLSYGKNMNKGGGKEPGEDGYAWLPRVFSAPAGWKIIHREAAEGRPVGQELLLLRRS